MFIGCYPRQVLPRTRVATEDDRFCVPLDPPGITRVGHDLQIGRHVKFFEVRRIARYGRDREDCPVGVLDDEIIQTAYR